MKELIDFINKDKCPCCEKKLSFYMKMLYSNLFRISNDKMYNNDILVFSSDLPETTESAYMNMSNATFNLSEALYNKNHHADMFFFGICNENAIEKKDVNSLDFEINVHDICYYKSTKFLVFNETENGLFFKISENDKKINNLYDGIISFEAFSFVDDTDDSHKSYMMQIEHILRTTSLWYYSCSIEDTKNEDYEPKIFHKEINAIKKNIDFSNKEKVINIFNNWILLS